MLRTAAVKELLHYDVLPVNDIDTGDTVDTYGLDSAKAGALLQSLFAPSLQKDRTGDTVRVLVENGIGTPDLVTAARDKAGEGRFPVHHRRQRLRAQRHRPERGPHRGRVGQSQARGARVAKSLGLPASSIQINPRGQTVADVIVILGADFRP